MSCSNDSNSNVCRQDIPYPQISSESVPSLISNLVYALYGTIDKSVVNGRVIWDIPCDPNNTAEADSIPREEGEGLLCYLLRLFDEYLSGGEFLRWGFSGSGQTTFTLPGAYQPNRVGYIAYINGSVIDPINYTISTTLPRVLTLNATLSGGSFLTIVELSSRAGATGVVGATGLSVTGSTGSTGLQGSTGPQGTPGGATGATGQQGMSGTAAAGGLRWAYVGNGILNTFALAGANSLIPAGYLVSIDGVVQDPNNYSIASGSPYNLVLSSPVPSGSTIVIVEIVGPLGATGIQGPQGNPGGATGATGLPSPAGGIRWAFSSDGSNTLFPLLGGFSILSTAYLVTFDGVTQDPANYTIAAGSPYSITLSSSPAAGVGIIIISLNGIEGATGPQGTPGGATGATGTQGVAGIQGATGAGSTGATGPVGPSFPSGGLRWAYTGDGSQTVFNIAGALTTLATAYLVTIDGITQDSANYTITAGSPYTLTISTVPSGAFIVITSLTAGLANWITGFGSPNGVVTAKTGSIYTNLNGGSLSTLYVKESGSGNTGWIAK